MAFGDIVLLKDRTPIGPFTRSRIQEGLGRGEFTPRDLAHTPGLKDWLPLLEVLHHLDREVVHAPANREGRGLPPVPNAAARYAPPTELAAAIFPPEPALLPAIPVSSGRESKEAAKSTPPPLESTPRVAPSVAGDSPRLASAETPVSVASSLKAPQPPFLSKNQRGPGPMVPRIGAWFIDLLVLFLPVLITFGIAYAIWYARGPLEHRDAETARQEQELMMRNLRDLVLLVANGFAWLYAAGLESSAWQGTIGKQLMGLVVTDNAGHRISFLRATGRHAARYLSALPFFLGFIMALFNPQRLTWHDRLSGTRVVKR